MIKIKHRQTGAVIYSCDCSTLKEALIRAVKEKVNLRYSDLSYSDLSYSNLSYSDLRYSNLSYSNLSGSDLSYSNGGSITISASALCSATVREGKGE